MVARVTLDLAVRRDFDYLIPDEFLGVVEVGSRVRVPFGQREMLGSVTAVLEESPVTNLRPLLKVIGKQSLITPKVLALARWMAGYYCCPVSTALKSVLPEAVRQEEDGWRELLNVHVLAPQGEAPKLTPRQQEIYRVVEEWRELPLQELIRLTGCTAETVRRLEDKGVVGIAPKISERDPYGRDQIIPSQPLALNPEQAVALGRVVEAIDRVLRTDAGGGVSTDAAGAGAVSSGAGAGATGPAAPEPVGGAAAAAAAASTFLLHGVTGSGKTEVYLQAIAHALSCGLGAIILVPEISLTPQTVERFKARFSSGANPELVAVLHSHLSGGERHDEWHKIRQGRARIVIGARSAVFAPVDPLGLIVVDEEHEHSYKQEESPRYHARDLAVVRGQREGAVVLLGSATPCLESYYNARNGKYTLLTMPTRVDEQVMPLVRVVDMRHEMRGDKGIPVFSRRLREAILQRLEKKEQTILFLNRRGYSTSLQCPKCGYVAGCPNCSVSLTYHRPEQRLCCHICGHQDKAPNVCPVATCRNPAIRYAGIGTQRVEEQLGKLFPTARIQRMDSDTLQRKEDYRRILTDFRVGKIDILLGTQMIAKGLHFPNVTLVGIIYADQTLHQPDFRAAERTFQLLTQVSGRAGRGDVEGEVVVQAFTPFHASIQYARKHDFEGFYEQEIEFRQQLRYPPYSRVALFTLKGRNEDKVKVSSDYIRKELETHGASIGDLIIAGPAPAPLMRAEGFYRYQIMLRTRWMAKLSRCLGELLTVWRLPEDISMALDIDPTNLS